MRIHYFKESLHLSQIEEEENEFEIEITPKRNGSIASHLAYSISQAVQAKKTGEQNARSVFVDCMNKSDKTSPLLHSMPLPADFDFRDRNLARRLARYFILSEADLIQVPIENIYSTALIKHSLLNRTEQATNNTTNLSNQQLDDILKFAWDNKYYILSIVANLPSILYETREIMTILETSRTLNKPTKILALTLGVLVTLANYDFNAVIKAEYCNEYFAEPDENEEAPANNYWSHWSRVKRYAHSYFNYFVDTTTSAANLAGNVINFQFRR
jgi:hypothetical protein